MKKLLKSALAAVVLAAPSLALAAEYDIDPVHTHAQFKVRHMMVTDVKGEFGQVTGTLQLNEEDITRSSVNVTIDATTLDTRNAKRDAHLKSADFFDVENHKTLTFKSTKVEKVAEGKLKVTGDLTLRGVTRQVVLDVTGPTAPYKHPFTGGSHVGVSATTKLNRLDYGLKWNKAMESGGLFVGNDVEVALEVELIQKEATPATAKSTP